MKLLSHRQPLFSIVTKDCEWDYYRGSGKGGQKKNKTSSAVRCRHLPSKAIGQSQDGRSQGHNKRLAFRRMAMSKEFQKWVKMEASRRAGVEDQARIYADKEINSNRVRVEIRNDGRWQED